jgi:imidazole glycerol-phosphate synthase subunit HisH
VSVAIVDYGSGNLHSAAKAFERANWEAGLDVPILVTANPDFVRKADRIVLPGVGAFADCRQGLMAVPDLVEAMEEVVLKKGKPFLGICVGMQLLATRGLEHGVTPGLGWISGDVAVLTPKDARCKIPHMGWNSLKQIRPHPLLEGLTLGETGWHAYFVHSYAFMPENLDHRLAMTEHGGDITAMIGRDNLAGTQFHPEKSQKLGLALITNFLRWSA